MAAYSVDERPAYIPSSQRSVGDFDATAPEIGLETADIETSSDDYARRFAGATGAWFLDVQRNATIHMLSAFAGATILDVGGGHGQMTAALAERGYQLTVLGSAMSCMQRIRNLVESNRCVFRVGNVLHLPYPDQSFDVVMSFRLLPHVTHWQQLLSELCRVARRAVILDYPTVRSVNYIAPHLFRLKKKLEGNTRPYTCFREDQILDTVQPLGYTRSGRYAEFFMPMVLHRAMKMPGASSALESVFRVVQLTGIFGSPVILKLDRMSGQS